MNKAIVLLLTAACLPLAAKYLGYAGPRTPRAKDGKPNLTAPAPRMNGKPDLTGLWQAERTPQDEYDRVLGNGFTARADRLLQRHQAPSDGLKRQMTNPRLCAGLPLISPASEV